MNDYAATWAAHPTVSHTLTGRARVRRRRSHCPLPRCLQSVGTHGERFISTAFARSPVAVVAFLYAGEALVRARAHERSALVWVGIMFSFGTQLVCASHDAPIASRRAPDIYSLAALPQTSCGTPSEVAMRVTQLPSRTRPAPAPACHEQD